MIKNIIFDLGNVIINIDEVAAANHFAELGFDVNQFYNSDSRHPVFTQFETGKIEEEEFFEMLRNLASRELSIEQLREAWNTVLLDIPNERISFLQEISKEYRCLLLSNTNITHMKQIKQQVLQTYRRFVFDELFEKQYYSYELGMKKPSKEIFEHVLQDSGINPVETIYAEDTQMHLDSASKLGINPFLVSPQNDVLKLRTRLTQAETINV